MTATPSGMEKLVARAIAQEIAQPSHANLDEVPSKDAAYAACMSLARAALAAACPAIRREALEEAARAARRVADMWKESPLRYAAARNIEEEIRSLQHRGEGE